ncbi:geranyltranstransferase [Campylobacterota bacterium]|nr:geranyltranstransferase [Campylobacterota bacterium]
MRDFEEFLQANLPKAPSFHPHYEKALGEMLLAGGKRFRPALLIAAAVGIDPAAHRAAFAPALAIEMLHTYSLIHDDLPAMDNADFRRSHPTLHKTYDYVTAILVGDALNTHAFSVLAHADLSSAVRADLVAVLADNGGANAMVLGQALDCHFEGVKLTIAQLEFIHIHKTAKMIAASLKMGAIVAGADSGLQDRLYDLGLDLGLFFQIRDDIIDATGDEAAAGKPTHNDTAKNSYTNLLGVDGATDRLYSLGEKIKHSIADLPHRLPIALGEVLKEYLD